MSWFEFFADVALSAVLLATVGVLSFVLVLPAMLFFVMGGVLITLVFAYVATRISCH